MSGYHDYSAEKVGILRSSGPQKFIGGTFQFESGAELKRAENHRADKRH
jgi:hypothetical protein